MAQEGWHVFGVDPAPKKDTVVCSGPDAFEVVPAAEMQQWLQDALEGREDVLVAWDAPLSFDRGDYFDRRIDRAARQWIGALQIAGVVGPKAASARAFTGLPHWAITCDVVGYPFNSAPRQLELVEKPGRRHCLVEVHPTVALGAMWADKQGPVPMMRYKDDNDAAAAIAEQMCFPAASATDGDHLDAYIAFLLGRQLLEGKARLVGTVESGGYVMPDGPATRDLEAILRRLA